MIGRPLTTRQSAVLCGVLVACVAFAVYTLVLVVRAIRLLFGEVFS